MWLHNFLDGHFENIFKNKAQKCSEMTYKFFSHPEKKISPVKTFWKTLILKVLLFYFACNSMNFFYLNHQNKSFKFHMIHNFCRFYVDKTWTNDVFLNKKLIYVFAQAPNKIIYIQQINKGDVVY